MKERPIIFSSEMVQAILDGRKTQTRRVMKPPLPSDFRFAKMLADGRAVFDVGNGWQVEYVNCPYGAPGDRLWVREKWRIVGWGGETYQIQYADGIILEEPGDSSEYDEDAYMKLFEQCDKECTDAGLELDDDDYYIFKDGVIPTRWRSPIHMPRWASRITLEITDIWMQRVQEILFYDLQQEGMQGELTKAVKEYIRLWDSLNEKRGYPWSSNPWAWVIEFERLPQSPHEGLAQ